MTLIDKSHQMDLCKVKQRFSSKYLDFGQQQHAKQLECFECFQFFNSLVFRVLDIRYGSSVQWRVVCWDSGGKLNSLCSMQHHKKVTTPTPWNTIVSACHSAKINSFCFFSTDEVILLLIPELLPWTLAWGSLLHSEAVDKCSVI